MPARRRLGKLTAAHDLPATRAALVYRQGQAVRSDPDFHHDMDRLIQGLEDSQAPELTVQESGL